MICANHELQLKKYYLNRGLQLRRILRTMELFRDSCQQYNVLQHIVSWFMLAMSFSTKFQWYHQVRTVWITFCDASHARLQLRSDQQLDLMTIAGWDLVSPSFKSCHGSDAYKARTRKHRTASAIFSMHAYVATSEMLPGLDPVAFKRTCRIQWTPCWHVRWNARHTHLHAYHTCIPVSFFLLFLYTVYSFYIYAVRHLLMWMIARYSDYSGKMKPGAWMWIGASRFQCHL
jgi:hypothetical protein